MKIDLHKILQTRIKKLNKQIKEEIITRNSAPTPMQSGSDKTRQVAEQIIDSLLQEKKNLLSLKKSLKSFPKFNQRAILNTFVTLKSKTGERTYLLVSEGLGGITAHNVFFLSITSPLAKKLLNQKTGFRFRFNNLSYQVVSISSN